MAQAHVRQLLGCYADLGEEKAMSSLPWLPLCAVRNTSPTRITLEPLQYKSPDFPLSLSKRAS